ARLVTQRRAVTLRELARYIEAEAGAPGLSRVERLEDLFHLVGFDAGTAVRDVEKLSARLLEQAAGDLDSDGPGLRTRVLDRVVAEVPQNLMQVGWVHSHLDLGCAFHDRHRALIELERLDELACE